MNAIVTAKMDVAADRRIAKESTQQKRVVRLNYSVAGNSKKTYTHQEVWKNVEKILNTHYGTDYKLEL